MTGTEVIVVAFGLFIGYWVVSKLLAGRSYGDEAPAPWHEVLEVAPDASVDEIRAAYQRRIEQSPGKSKELAAAYQEAMRARGAEA